MTSSVAALKPQAPIVKMLLDGKFIDSKSTEWHDVVNPATQEVLAQVPFATDAEIDAAVASAKAAFKTWKNTPIAARAPDHAEAAGAGARKHEPHRTDALRGAGKTLADAEGDVFRGLEVVEHACSIGTLQLGGVRRKRGRRRRHLHHAPAHRGVRRNFAVQFPGDDSAMDVPDGDRVRQHLRAQALRARIP